MEFLLPSNVPNSLKGQVYDARPVLHVNKKYTWISRNGARDLNDLTTIVVHHDALSKASSSKYSDLEFANRIADSHIRSEHNIKGGDPGFPYHIFIRSGVVYVCNDLEAFTYGVASNNAYTVHICVSGNYTMDKLEDRDRNALYAAILMIKSLVPTIKHVKGHNEITATSCPAFSMELVRKDVEAFEKEMSLGVELENTDNAKLAQVYAAFTRFNDLYKIASKENPNQAEAIRKCLLIADMMVQQGILKQ